MMFCDKDNTYAQFVLKNMSQTSGGSRKWEKHPKESRSYDMSYTGALYAIDNDEEIPCFLNDNDGKQIRCTKEENREAELFTVLKGVEGPMDDKAPGVRDALIHEGKQLTCAAHSKMRCHENAFGTLQYAHVTEVE